ncbi:hypothetical protein HFN89_00545 [Rhizobium laguerreae]|nr:hypothetical protein [Rhizobium laguerreae]
MKIDDDPLFMSWVEQWIANEIDMGELRRRYTDLRRLRHQERRQRKSGTVVDASVPPAAVPAPERGDQANAPLDSNSLEAVLLSLQKHVEAHADAVSRERRNEG